MALCDVDMNGLQSVAEEVTALGRTALCLHLDVSNEAQVRSVFTQTIEKFGRLDILVTSAGISHSVNIQDLTLKDWNRIMNINLTGTFLCCRGYPLHACQQLR